MNRILVIEDVPELQNLLSLILKSQNLTVDVASSKQQADTLLQQLPRLVILDLDFEFFNGGGTKMYTEIRTDARYQHIPVLILSTDTKVLAMYKNLYKAVTLDKPFDLTTITGKVRSLLNKMAV